MPDFQEYPIVVRTERFVRSTYEHIENQKFYKNLSIAGAICTLAGFGYTSFEQESIGIAPLLAGGMAIGAGIAGAVIDKLTYNQESKRFT